MKIVICTTAGSAGKTVTAVHMLIPRLPKYRVISVDTTNDTPAWYGIPCEVFNGEEFSKLYREIVKTDDMIIDVAGSGEGKSFIEGMNWMSGSEDIDRFIIPSKPDDKDQKEAVKTIDLLLAQGVAPEKISVVFNRVKKDTVKEFDFLLGAMQAKSIPIVLEASIFDQEIYNILHQEHRSLQSILSDPTDYKAVVRQAPADADIESIMNLMIAQKAAPRANEVLDSVFNALFPPAKVKEMKRAKGQ